MDNWTFPRWYGQTNMEPQLWIPHMDAWRSPVVGAFVLARDEFWKLGEGVFDSTVDIA